MAFAKEFLDQLRASVPVSEVVGRRMKLKKHGSEFRAIEDNSLTVNDTKGLWWDHARSKEGGDQFAWLTDKEGLSFPEAVEEMSKLAGLPMPNGAAGAPTSKAPALADDPPFDLDAYDLSRGSRATAAKPPERDITMTYDYTDAQGELLYQVVRQEWFADGKRKKTFLQRRPDGDGHWIWGLSAGEFVRARSGDWYQLNKDREKWLGERMTVAEAVPHGLYRLVEFNELKSDGEPAFILEGEKDVETARKWQLVATTNSGGAKNWSKDHAEHFRGLNVVIPVDNDEAGRKRGETIAQSLSGIAASIRILDWTGFWKDAPKGADLTDWRELEEGTREQFLEIVAKLPAWRPAPFASQFGGISFEQLDDPGPEHAHVIDGLITVGDKSVVGGASQSGKSFLAIHMGMCIATARPFFGRKILTPGLVIYQAGEGGRGIKKRFRAWRQHFGVPKDRRVPLYILQSKVDIHSHEGDTGKLIAEVKGISQMYGLPVVALFIDTLAKASGAADENSGRDMGVVMGNVDRIAEAVPGCHVCLVHHMNAGGTKLRGHTSVYAGVDQVILVTKDPETKLRTALLDKQKDDEEGAMILFELMQVEIGRRSIDGKPITSCVTLSAGEKLEIRGQGRIGERTMSLSDQNANILAALRKALGDHGEPVPAPLRGMLPRSIATVVQYKFWRDAFEAVAFEKNPATVRKAMERAGPKFLRLGIIGRDGNYVWLTGRQANSGPLPLAGGSSLMSETQGEFEDAMMADN